MANKISIRNRFYRSPTVCLDYPRDVPVFGYDEHDKRVVKVGEKNLVSFIDAPREDCNVYSKIGRFVNGDVSALGGGFAKDVYTDISGLPTDLNTIHKVVSKANNIVSSNGKSDIVDYLKSLFTSAQQLPLEDTTTTLDKESKNNAE